MKFNDFENFENVAKFMTSCRMVSVNPYGKRKLRWVHQIILFTIVLLEINIPITNQIFLITPCNFYDCDEKFIFWK